jgi:hypothetical protein
MIVVHESSNLSETGINAVSHIFTTTPKTPLYETRAEGRTLLYLRQSPSACKFPTIVNPFCLPDTGAGIFLKSNTTTFARADSNYLGPTERKGQIGKPAGLESGDDRLRSPFLSYSVTLLEMGY